MNKKTFVCLKIRSGGLTPEEITGIIGIKCDSSWKVADLRSKTAIKEKDNGWVIESGIDEKEDLMLHIKTLLKRVNPYAKEINFLSQNNLVEFSCAIYSKHIPELYFEKNILSQISELGACFDIDLYLI